MNWPIRQATYHLAKGNIIAYPTEAIYGMGCDPQNLHAVRRLLQLKQRPWQKGLILIAANYDQLQPYLQPLSDEIKTKVFATWPGPVTWLLPARRRVSPLLRGQSHKLAVRITAHPLAKALCHHWRGAIVSTSANITQQQPAKTASQVRHTFGLDIDYIVNGPLGDRCRPSEIRDGVTDKVLRL